MKTNNQSIKKESETKTKTKNSKKRKETSYNGIYKFCCTVYCKLSVKREATSMALLPAYCILITNTHIEEERLVISFRRTRKLRLVVSSFDFVIVKGIDQTETDNNT